jgi:hypothetical protein
LGGRGGGTFSTVILIFSGGTGWSFGARGNLLSLGPAEPVPALLQLSLVAYALVEQVLDEFVE